MITVTTEAGISFKVYLAPEVNGGGKPTFKVAEIIDAEDQIPLSFSANPNLYDEVGRLAIEKADKRVAANQ